MSVRSTRLDFAKYHGLGNDFLVVDLRAGFPTPSPLEPATARALCDRRFGIGGDGVLAILPPRVQGADARMVVVNADGSTAEMCGNGIRCVAKHLFDRDAAMRKTPIAIETDAGVLSCGIGVGDDGRATTVSVEMGRPRLRREEVPMEGSPDARCLEEPLVVGEATLAVTAVSMGNPHAVVFVDESGPELRRLAERIGPQIETHRAFPRRTNAELAHVASADSIELVVWERGCGITLACGTGACATAVAACLTGRSQPGRELAVRLLGGTLAITVAADYAGVTMRGPASLVYTGHVDVAAITAEATARPS